MSTQVNRDQEYRTDDMGLVTWLHMRNHYHTDVLNEDGVCWWMFVRTSELLSDVVDFQDDLARVSPRLFSRNFKNTRSEFHTARGVQPKGR